MNLSMSQKEALKIFENKNVRVVWDDELQDIYVGTNCPLVLMITPTGTQRKTLAANYEHLLA